MTEADQKELEAFRKHLAWLLEIKALVLFKDGSDWCAVRPDFTNLEESPAWFGNTRIDAILHAETQPTGAYYS
jgi:hypothetical protein